MPSPLINVPTEPFDYNIINQTIPVTITTVQILSTDIGSFAADLTDSNDNLLTVLSDNYASTIKNDFVKVSTNNINIDNGLINGGTQRICVASNNLPITVTPSGPITTIETISNTMMIQTNGLTDQVQLNTDLNDFSSKGQDLMTNSIPITIASDQPDLGVILDTTAFKFYSQNDSININIRRFNGQLTDWYNTGSANDGVKQVILTDDYLSTNSSKITDMDITVQTNDMYVNVTNNPLSVDINTVNGTNISLSQQLSSLSIPIILSSNEPSIIIAANAGTNLNTSSLARENIGNLSIISSYSDSIGTSISSTNNHVPTQNQKNMSQSLPVVIASNQSIFDVFTNAGTNLNTSLLALENGANLDTIDSNVDNIDTNIASIDTKFPVQGQTTMAASSPITIANNQSEIAVNQTQIVSNSINVTFGTIDTGTQRIILTDDYLSTVIRQSYIPFTLTYNVADFTLIGNTNMAQSLGFAIATGVSTLQTGGSDIIFAHKLTMTIEYVSGTPDSNAWGTAGQVLAIGFELQYRPDSIIGDIKLHGTNRIRTLKDVIKIFDTSELYSWGTGDVFKASLFFKKPLIIDTGDSGVLQYYFNADDLTGGATVGSFETHIWYWSLPV